MSDENKPSQAEAVREPLDTQHTQMTAAVEQAEGEAETAAATQMASAVENSPLGAYRRGRTRVSERSTAVAQDGSGSTNESDENPAVGDESAAAGTGAQSPAPPIESAPTEPTPAATTHSETAPSEAAPAESRQAPEPPTPNRAIGTIEVPPPIQQLDAALAAEIDAAMASSELAEVEAVSPATLEGEEGKAEKPPE